MSTTMWSCEYVSQQGVALFPAPPGQAALRHEVVLSRMQRDQLAVAGAETVELFSLDCARKDATERRRDDRIGQFSWFRISSKVSKWIHSRKREEANVQISHTTVSMYSTRRTAPPRQRSYSGFPPLRHMRLPLLKHPCTSIPSISSLNNLSCPASLFAMIPQGSQFPADAT